MHRVQILISEQEYKNALISFLIEEQGWGVDA